MAIGKKSRTNVLSVGSAIKGTLNARFFDYLKQYKQNLTFQAKVLVKKSVVTSMFVSFSNNLI